MVVMEFPIEDLVKVGTGGAGGVGLMALIARFLRGDMKRMELSQAKINNDLYAKATENAAAINRTELKMAEEFVRKTEFAQLQNHIDAQFTDQRNFFMELLRTQK